MLVLCVALVTGLLSSLPVVGRPLFVQPITTYALYVLVPLVAWWLYRTHAGLALRAVGENPAAADAAGLDIIRHAREKLLGEM